MASRRSRPPAASRRPAAGVLLAASLLLVAFNLRPAIAALGPVLGTIRRQAHLAPVAAGTLTTLPLVCFGILAFIAPRLVHRIGVGRLILACLLGMTAGIVVRSVPSDAALFAGTLVVGISVAITNVLMPGIVKKDFPHRVGLMTGLYTMALSAGPAVATGLSVPLEHAFSSWRLAIGFWAVPAVVAAFVWLPFRRHDRPDEIPTPHLRGGLSPRDPVVWGVAVYMGLQSLSFYAVLAWLPTILHSRGLSLVEAGVLLSLANVLGIVSALLAPLLTHRMRDERIAIAGSTTALAAGFVGLLLDPHGPAVVWVILLGLGQGSAISLALMVMVLRAWNTRQATALSAVAQGCGYLIAAVGPALAGAVYGVSHSWDAALLLLLGLLAPQYLAGWRAGHGRLRQPAEVTQEE